jgi:hypothetical protein
MAAEAQMRTLQMKTLTGISLACAVTLMAAGAAAADTIGVLIKNTLTMTDAQGGVTTAWFSEGGRMRQIDPAGMRAEGAWQMEGPRLCWTARGKSRICVPLEEDKSVGDTWEIKGPTGKVAGTLAIVEGREGETGP